MPIHHPVDPFYENANGPAGWVRERAQDRGLQVVIDETLHTPGFANMTRGIIVARPGLSFPTFHWLLACGIVAQIFGPDAAPELPLAPVRTSMEQLAQIIPIQRRLGSGTWAG